MPVNYYQHHLTTTTSPMIAQSQPAYYYYENSPIPAIPIFTSFSSPSSSSLYSPDYSMYLPNTTKKAPDSFSLYAAKRHHELEGQMISPETLEREWQLMSKEQKAEFQNQSQCIQFTLDIDQRAHTTEPPTYHSSLSPPPSSMVIPNDHSPQHSPLLEEDGYGSPAYGFLHPPVYQQQVDKLNLSYSAAAEAAALDSLSFNTPIPTPIKTSPITKRRYGILPQKVKRPPNAYLLFNRDMRRQLHDVNQGLSSGEISKSISLRWKQLSPAEKEYYFNEESKLKQQHNSQHANFIYSRRSKAEMKEACQLKKQQKKKVPPTVLLSEDTPIVKSTQTKKSSLVIAGRDPRGRKKKKADDTLPKHPMSAYLHFAKEMRPIMKRRYPEARLVEISREIGHQWRSMSPYELQPWVDIANRDKARYAKEMKDRILLQEHQHYHYHQQAMMDDSFSILTSSSSSSCTSSPSLVSMRQHEFSDLSLDNFDSHAIATVAHMVNPIVQ